MNKPELDVTLVECMGCGRGFEWPDLYEFDILNEGLLTIACKDCVKKLADEFPEEVKRILKGKK